MPPPKNPVSPHLTPNQDSAPAATGHAERRLNDLNHPDYEEAVRALFSLGRELAAPRHARTQKFGLANITILAEHLGNPQRARPAAHIAGTNGKGSTAAMLESILRVSGLRTGLYTSPHLERVNERIRIAGENISDEQFAAVWGRVEAAAESLLASGTLAAHPAFFECVTAMAFLTFANESVQFAVYEVGLGGRLDATNIVQPEVAVITAVDFDHESFLGHSIEEIAAEKAGIIKAGCHVVSANERAEVRRVIARRCREVQAPLVEIDELWQLEELAPRDGRYRAVAKHRDGSRRLELAPRLPGRFQIRNALAAATAAIQLAGRGYPIDDRTIEKGIAAAEWPGRMERLSERPAVYLDGAHNPAGARELARFWEENLAGRRIVLIYGAMRDKAVEEIAETLFPRAETVIFTQPRQTRAVSASVLADMTSDLARHSMVAPDPAEALEKALSISGPDDAVFGTGSLYLVGDLKADWKRRGDPQAAANHSSIAGSRG